MYLQMVEVQFYKAISKSIAVLVESGASVDPLMKYATDLENLLEHIS